jgi:hypothetical protein
MAAPAAADRRPPPDRLTVITSIGSPIALATALLFYFGWVRSEEQAKAFGADASVFAMSTQDYVLRSINILFFPLVLLLLVGLLMSRLDRSLRRRAVPGSRIGTLATLLRFSWALFLPLGLVLLAVAGEFGDVTLPFWVTLAIVGPAYGILLGRLVRGDDRRFPYRVVALLAALVTVCLFWQTERLARLGGEALAQDVKDNLDERLAAVRLLTAKDLQLTEPGVTMTRLTGDDTAYRFAYTGLYLLQRSGGKYFLLTDGWDRDEGRLVVLPDDPDNRLEFGP